MPYQIVALCQCAHVAKHPLWAFPSPSLLCRPASGAAAPPSGTLLACSSTQSPLHPVRRRPRPRPRRAPRDPATPACSQCRTHPAWEGAKRRVGKNVRKKKIRFRWACWAGSFISIFFDLLLLAEVGTWSYSHVWCMLSFSLTIYLV